MLSTFHEIQEEINKALHYVACILSRAYETRVLFRLLSIGASEAQRVYLIILTKESNAIDDAIMMRFV